MIRYLFIILSCLLVTLTTNGQHASDSSRSKYIQEFPDKFFVWPYFKKRSLSFDIRDGNNKKIDYKPNNAVSLGLGVYMFEIAAEISFTLPINENNQTTYGTTDARDVHANFMGNNWGVDVFRQKYNGFYFIEPSKSPTNTVVKRPDIQLINTGVNGIYAFNKKDFSLKSAYNYSERQLKSGGSVIITGNLNTFRLSADSAIVTNNTSASTNTNLLFMRFTTLSVAGGYAYTLVYRSFFLNGALSLGPAHNWILYNRSGGKEYYDVAVNTYSDIRVSIGYNSDRIFGGMSLVTQSRYIRFDDIRFANTNTFVKLMIGYRFNEFGILKKRAHDYIPVNLR